MMDSAHPVPVRNQRRELAAASVGNTVELFDWLIFASLAPYFASSLFPGNSVAGLLYAYAVFAVGFVMRPIGAIVMGRVVDRKGRRFALLFSVLVTSAAALVIAVTPTYQAIGLGAAIIVVVARLIQGLTISGEQAAVSTYLLETAPAPRRFTFAAIAQSAVSIGQLLTVACVAVLVAGFGQAGMEAGGWRLGFVACGVLGVIALIIRRLAPETDTFIQQVKVQRPPQLPLLARHRRVMVAVFLSIAPTSMGLYFVTAYLPTYFAEQGVADRGAISTYLPLLTLYLIAMVLIAGPIADRVGGLRLARIANATFAVITVPVILAVNTRALPVIAGILIYLTVLGFVTAPVSIIGVNLFPPAIRGVGAGVPTAMSVALFGGTFPLIAQSLTVAGNADLVPWIVGLGALLGFLGMITARHSDLQAIDNPPNPRRFRTRPPRPSDIPAA
jgi:MHS family alpha-ketoglutarate permease-like MFS transporter